MENNKKSSITALIVVLLIITIISILAVIVMYEVVQNTKEEKEMLANQILETTNLEVEEERIKEFIDNIYFIALDLIPTFNDINSVDDNWIWSAAHINLFRDGKDPGMYVTKEQVDESAEEIFGDNLKKEFPVEGLEFWLEPEDGKYFVACAGLDPDYVNDYEIIDIITEDEKIIVEIAEYKYNTLRDDTTLEIINIENNQTVTKINKKDYIETDPELFESLRLYEKVSDYVINNLEQFSKAKLTLQMNEETERLYIVSVERAD